MVSELVDETEQGQDIQLEQADHVRIRKLAACMVRFWAEAFNGTHAFQMVHVVAQGLSMAAGILDNVS